jgi:hypothetical protein
LVQGLVPVQGLVQGLEQELQLVDYFLQQQLFFAWWKP